MSIEIKNYQMVSRKISVDVRIYQLTTGYTS